MIYHASTRALILQHAAEGIAAAIRAAVGEATAAEIDVTSETRTACINLQDGRSVAARHPRQQYQGGTPWMLLFSRCPYRQCPYDILISAILRSFWFARPQGQTKRQP